MEILLLKSVLLNNRGAYKIRLELYLILFCMFNKIILLIIQIFKKKIIRNMNLDRFKVAIYSATIEDINNDIMLSYDWGRCIVKYIDKTYGFDEVVLHKI